MTSVAPAGIFTKATRQGIPSFLQVIASTRRYLSSFQVSRSHHFFYQGWTFKLRGTIKSLKQSAIGNIYVSLAACENLSPARSTNVTRLLRSARFMFPGESEIWIKTALVVELASIDTFPLFLFFSLFYFYWGACSPFVLIGHSTSSCKSAGIRIRTRCRIWTYVAVR